MKIVREDSSLPLEINVFYDCSLIMEGAFIMEFEGAGINVGRFYIYGGGKLVNIHIYIYIYTYTHTPAHWPNG